MTSIMTSRDVIRRMTGIITMIRIVPDLRNRSEIAGGLQEVTRGCGPQRGAARGCHKELREATRSHVGLQVRWGLRRIWWATRGCKRMWGVEGVHTGRGYLNFLRRQLLLLMQFLSLLVLRCPSFSVSCEIGDTPS
jgi:hypothetical protein